jgi:hypothetical protein
MDRSLFLVHGGGCSTNAQCMPPEMRSGLFSKIDGRQFDDSQCALEVKASHLKRNAYLYVRQSMLRQVLENTESTQPR